MPTTNPRFADTEMRELLDLCVRIDAGAERTYHELAERCADFDLAEIFRRMAADEGTHREWWARLLEAYEAGLVPVLNSDTDELLKRMRDILTELDSGKAEQLDCSDLDGMLEVATHLEFFMLDPVFGELIELTEPANSHRHLVAYSRHIERLAGAIERFYGRSELAVFLAGVLRRSWSDFSRSAELTRYDQLTHVLNRRGLFSALDQWAAWSGRYERPLAVVTIDLDHFKDINDRHGHAAGDLALVAFTTALRETCREADLIGRQGGDEFTVVAPETDGEALTRLMYRIVAEIPERTAAEWPFHLTTPIEVSVGGAWTSGDRALNGETLLNAADSSMYGAKDAGRNRAGEVRRLGACEKAG